jgi:hypothetical protein
MKAKKLLAGVCASIMLAATAAPVVSAADSVKVTVGNAKVKAGEEFSVTVDLADIPAAGINGCDFGIEYDSSIINITGATAGPLAKDDASGLEGVNTLEVNTETGLVSIVYGLASGTVTGSGTFVTLNGSVKASAKEGDKSDLKVVAINRLAKPEGTETNSDIIFGLLDEDNSTFTNYTPTITNGYIEVEGEGPTEETTVGPTDGPSEELPPASLLGDVDLNGEVGIGDVVAISKYLVNKKSYALVPEALANADVTRNKVVDALDQSKLIEYNLKKITEL